MADTAADSLVIENPTPDQWLEMARQLREGKPAKPAPAESARSVPGITVTGREPTSVPTTPVASAGEPPATETAPDTSLQGPLAETGPGRMFNRGKTLMEAVPWLGRKVKESGQAMVDDPQYRRETLRTVGSFGGGLAGGAAGLASPIPGGTALGTLGGTHIGAATGDYLANIADMAQGKGEVKGALDIQKRALTDTALTGGIMTAATALQAPAKYLFSRLMKLPENAPELVKAAKEMGVDIGAANMPGTLGQKIVNVFGRIPVIGGGAQKAAREQAGQVMRAQEDIFGQVAAKAGELDDVGKQALEAGTKKFAEMSVNLQDKAQYAFRAGESAGPVIPADQIKASAKSLLDQVGSVQGGMRQFLTADEVRFLKGVATRDGNLTTIDSKIIDNFAENAIRRAAKKDNIALPALERFKQVNDDVLNSVDHPAAKLMSKFNSDYRTGMETMQSEVAQQFGGTSPNVFALGRTSPGAIKSPEDMMEKLGSLKTIQQVKDMREMVGGEPIRNMARAKLDQAWEGAMVSGEGEPLKFSAQKFEKALGLGDPSSRAYNVTKEMLEGSGITMGQLERLSTVAGQVAAAPVSDVSTFMARAATLRGAGNLADVFKHVVTLGIASGGAALNPVGTLATMLVARQGVAAMMKPGMIEAATFAMDKTAKQSVRVAGLTNLLTNTPREVLEGMLDDWVAQHPQGGTPNAAQ